jgi:hypothetical protein
MKAPAALKILKAAMDTSTIAASNLAKTVDTLLTADFAKFVYQSSGAQASLKKFTMDLLNNTQTTRQGQGDRAHLISDLEKSGMKAQQATAFVDGLSTSLHKLPANAFVNVHEKGTGLFTITGPGIAQSQGKGGSGNAAGGLATGGRIPGWGGGDKYPAMLEGGEAVVPKHLVAPIAPFLGSHGVPGFASGGMVGSGSFAGSIGGLPNFTTGFHNTFVKDMTLSMESAIKNGIQQAQASLAGTGVGGMGDSGARTQSAVVAQAYARSLLPMYGWGLDQMAPLIKLWNQESGWNANAVNPSSGAYGIPQSLGHGHPYNLGDYKNQIIWGLNYIKQRPGYGSPAAAWAHEVANNWYDQGGLLMPGLTLAHNNTGHPELITPLKRGGYSPSGGNGETCIYITVQAGDAVDPNAVAQAIHLKLRRFKKLKGGAPLGLD